MLKWAALENSHSILGTVLASRKREHRDSFSHFKNKIEASLVYVVSSRPVRLHSETSLQSKWTSKWGCGGAHLLTLALRRVKQEGWWKVKASFLHIVRWKSPASASGMLRLKAYATTPAICFELKKKVKKEMKRNRFDGMKQVAPVLWEAEAGKLLVQGQPE